MIFMSVCWGLPVRSCISKTTCRDFTNFLYMLPVAVTRSSHDCTIMFCTSGFVHYCPTCHPSWWRMHLSAVALWRHYALFACTAPAMDECIHCRRGWQVIGDVCYPDCLVAFAGYQMGSAQVTFDLLTVQVPSTWYFVAVILLPCLKLNF